MIYFFLISIIIIDQITKKLSIVYLKNSDAIVIIKDYLQLKYVENRGAAFGILQNKQLFLTIFSIIIIIGLFVYVKNNNKLKKVTIYTIYGIIGGAIGNLIDRIRYNFVVDFIDFNFGGYYDFPVFNIADSILVVATILLSILILMDKYERDDINEK